MHRSPDSTLRFSPSDLVAYLEGDFASWCARRWAERERSPAKPAFGEPIFRPDGDDPDSALIIRKGREHEQGFLTRLKEQGPVVELPQGSRDTGPTLDAMKKGAPVIYQPYLTREPFAGYPDFLVRVPGPSSLGDYHYEPWDTKLARSAKPYFLVQLSAYAEMLEAVQGVRPVELVFVLGSQEERRFRTDEHFYYYLELKQAFLDFQAAWTAAAMPDPGLDRSWGGWTGYAEQLLEASDHLSRVANITRSQVKRLEAAGVTTMAALGSATELTIPRIAQPVLARLRLQARLQGESAALDRPGYVTRAQDPAEPRRGLALLPPPSRLDVFFDMEGFPWAEGGLEYLFGATAVERGSAEFHDWWAHDPAGEKRAFEGFVDWACARWRNDPAMHIYHYAAYERSALRRLMGRYATRETEVDDLLRHDVLVDLYTVVRQGLTIGTPSYSLKDIERAYGVARSGEVKTAAGSVVEYQRWIDSGEPPDWGSSEILSAIRDYNRADCESTWQLREWLLERQREQGIEYLPARSAELAAERAAPAAPKPEEILAKELLERVEREGEAGGERVRVLELLAWLLEFHRREEKPMWWRMFERTTQTEEELFQDPDCLAGLERTGRAPLPIPRSKKVGLEYRFDPDQDTKMHAGSKAFAAHDLDWNGEITEFDAQVGRVVLKCGGAPDRLNLIPNDYVPADSIKAAILRFVEAWARGGTPSQAVDDLLFRRGPRIKGPSGGPLIVDGSEVVPQAVNIASRLDGTTLCIQGPPGTGKTFTSAALIASLLRDGKRIGVTSHSHRAIINLMNAVADRLGPDAARFPMVKIGTLENSEGLRNRIALSKPELAAAACNAGPGMFGGTAWFFSRGDVQGCFDYLFVDEAGQVSLANLVAMGPSARNLVLVGDQMQLAQPTQGSHPGESGQSCLEYLLNGHATIPRDFGIFLGESRRMHPDVCRFISDAVYEGRLGSNPDTRRQRIVAPANVGTIGKETGVLFVPVEHDGNAQCSPEEVEQVQSIVRELLGRTVVDQAGMEHPLALDQDILFVAPYNMQVRLLQAALGPTARVGSVDRFQGLEAPVVIVSLASSSLEDSPRGAEFLLSRNRLNVAVSRAQALAIVVGSPALLTPRCGSVEEMALVNLLCRLKHYGSEA